MADNGKLQFFGQIVYPQTLSTNILNPDGTPAPVLPIPSPANVGKVPVVNATGNGYELQAQGSGGGITQSTVIERPESLPTATADSPDFVQTPDGTLYRKKAVEGGSLLGTWVFNDNADCTTAYTFNISFSCSAFPSTNFTGITVTTSDRFGPWNVFYNYSGGTETVYNGTSSTAGIWINTAYKTIQITDTSALTNEAEFTSWLTANATQTGGGASVSYEYVAMQDAGASGGTGGSNVPAGYTVTVSSVNDVFLRDNKGILKRYVGNTTAPQETFQNIMEVYYSKDTQETSTVTPIQNIVFISDVTKNTVDYIHGLLVGDISITIQMGGGSAGL